ncbi:helix-turn-helix transcriptional regulator [Dongia rigui]|uniref:AraC family transcriptional regulator n=1 Tax=Dongia rigui TaxID=940149 RepID=A0ABU5E467_9PROT|nr:AraC family transcriptional regulator [Dongia rigui]MDY0874326.1 AraC family transcriptional regulator [Dongia rigui]
MNIQTPQDTLRRSLLDRLRPLADAPGRERKIHGQTFISSQLFTYCAFATERVAKFRVEHAIIGIVLSGTKEFWIGNTGQRFTTGQVFVLPTGAELDVVNIPDDRRGLYEALVVEVRHVPPALALPPERPRGPAAHMGQAVTLTAELVDALVHAAVTLSTSDHAKALADHRMAEVLMLLRNDPAAKCLFDLPLRDRIAWLVATEPAHPWTAEALGTRLGMGASTLRRRLTHDGTSLRAVLAEARMQVARNLLARGEANVTAAAEAAGYTSRSHFIRRYRSVYGTMPSDHLARRA